jgi:hypothetical protein
MDKGDILIAAIWTLAVIGVAVVYWLLADADEWCRVIRAAKASDEWPRSLRGDLPNIPNEADVSHNETGYTG